jgi:hypothetical protein
MNYLGKYTAMNKIVLYYIRKLLLLVLLSFLYIVWLLFNALRSIQIVRTVTTINANGKLLTQNEIDSLNLATTLSSENCDAISTLAGTYFIVAFPETDNGKSYNADFKNQKGDYNEELAAKALEFLINLHQCDS